MQKTQARTDRLGRSLRCAVGHSQVTIDGSRRCGDTPKVRGYVTGVLAVAAFAAPATAAPRAADPPRIVPWQVIGNVGLGMSRGRVEGMYGRGVVVNRPEDSLVWEYRGRGVIDVEYDLNDDVAAVATISPVYVTRSGVRVGRKLPPRLCHPVGYTCKRLWHGFAYETDYNTWDRISKLSRRARWYVELDLGRHSTVQRIAMTRFVECPRGEYATTNTCRRPPRGA